jgi:hypothetical protein
VYYAILVPLLGLGLFAGSLVRARRGAQPITTYDVGEALGRGAFGVVAGVVLATFLTNVA